MKPGVLVAAPVWEGHKYILPKYLARVKNLSYEKYNVLLVDNSKNPRFTKWLIGKGIKVIKIPYTEDIFERICNARNVIIRYLLQHKEFEYLLSLDTDVIPPRNIIEKLLKHKKDMVGSLVHSGAEVKVPCVLKDGFLIKEGKRRLSYYEWKEIAQMKKQKALHQVYATSVGCLLAHRKVFEAGVRFRYTPHFHIGEDVWFWAECNERGFKFYVDLSKRTPHFNKSKRKVIKSLLKKKLRKLKK